PLLTESSAGLVGSAGTASLTWSTVGLVTAVALGVAAVATAVPAVRGARSSTVSALADAARLPRRTGWLIAISARLPVPLLPALLGAVLGVFPGGFLLFAAINTITGGDSDRATLPSLWQLLALALASVLVVAALTAVPARLGGRRPVTETL